MGDRQQAAVGSEVDGTSAAGAGAVGQGAPVANETLIKPGPEFRPQVATELLRAEAGDVAADTVTMERAGAEHVTAQRVVMNNSGARTIEARSAQIDRSGVLAAQSEKAVFANSTIVAVAAEEARIVRGRVFAMKTDRATFEGETKIAIYAGPLPDQVRPLIDNRGAVICGAAMAGVLLVLGGLLRRLFRLR